MLVGGGTGMVGDPSGKRTERPMLSVEQIDANAARDSAAAGAVPRFEGANAARMRNNADWLRPLRLMEFLRDTGKHFTLNYMLQKESVKSRMETGISFTEFSYMLVQAYDFWHLCTAPSGCELQMGGSDQWGNITAGTELIGRREGAAGARAGLSAAHHRRRAPSSARARRATSGSTRPGPVPYQFYQFWLNTDDRDVERLLKFFTFLPLAEIAAIMAQQAARSGQARRPAALAEEVTARVHGDGTDGRGDRGEPAAVRRTRPSGGRRRRSFRFWPARFPTRPARARGAGRARRRSMRWYAPGWPAPRARPAGAFSGRASRSTRSRARPMRTGRWRSGDLLGGGTSCCRKGEELRAAGSRQLDLPTPSVAISHPDILPASTIALISIPSHPRERSAHASEFMKFLKEYGVIGLAIGVIIGEQGR